MRRGIFAALVLWLMPVLMVGAGGLGSRPAAAVAVGAALALAVAAALMPRLAAAFQTERGVPLPLGLALAAAAAVAIVQIGSVSVFMADVARQDFSVQPGDSFRREHSCATAYAEAARFLEHDGHNVYERELYRPGNAPRRLGPLTVDPFHYPPPFLLGPQVVRLLAPDFWDFRRLWFAIQALALAGAVVGLAAWIGGGSGAIALLGGLILLALPHAAAALQQGNFQITAAALAIAGFVMLIAGRAAFGGAMLAFAALAKIFPGVLVVSLVAGRRWRSVACVAGFGVALLALTLVWQGTGPMRDFASTSLPEISSGAAFPQAELAQHARVNWSAYGLTVRLRHLGAAWWTQRRGLVAAELYGVLVIAFAAWAGWRSRFDAGSAAGRIAVAQFALGLLGLASFRSPFVGALYGVFSTLWILTLFAARARTPLGSGLWIAALGAMALAIWRLPSPAAPFSPPWVWLSGFLLLACMAVNAAAVVRAVRSAPAEGLREPAPRLRTELT